MATTYATVQDLEGYVEGWSTDDEDAAERLIARAEDDVDWLLGVRPILDATGRKLDPASLWDWQAAALRRATCAQAEYRWALGEDFFRRSRPTHVKGPDFETFDKQPVIAPKAIRELQGAGLIVLGTVPDRRTFAAPGEGVAARTPPRWAS